MMMDYFANQHRSRTLNAQIRDAERQLLKDQIKVSVRSTILVNNIQQQITAPASLLLAAGFGFIIGELTWKRKTPKNVGSTDKSRRSVENTPFMTAFNLLISAHALYKTLPQAWLKKQFNQGKNVSNSSHKPQAHPASTGK
jgi:hypothetical protein